MRMIAGRVLAVLIVALWLPLMTSGCSSGGGTETDAGQDADAGEQTDEGPDGADEVADDGGQEGDGDQQIEDSETGTIEGIVILAGSGDHAGTLAVIDGLADRQAVTDAQGAYRIEQVPPGSHSITATHAGYEQRSTVGFQVVAGMVTTAPTLTLQPLTGSMTGYVYLENAADNEGSVVGVQGTIHATTTNQDGQWSISDVVAGNYTVVASHTGYLNNTATDQQVSGGELTVVPAITLIEKGDLGEDCIDETTCDSSWCVDGVCCENECAGFCQTCGGDIDGSGAVDVDEEGFMGACSYFEYGADLQDECPDDQGCHPGCDGSGACNFTCLQQGETCSVDEMCLSGNCVNEVCCLTSLCGQCERCDITDFEGVCHPVPAGGDSDGACTDHGGCSSNGLCDGQGECQHYDDSTPCEDGEECTLDDHCDGLGHCASGEPAEDFLLCTLGDTDPDPWYDICSDGACVSPGTCGTGMDAGCNAPGPHFDYPDEDIRPDQLVLDTSDQNNPVVTDSATGLMWQGCVQGERGADCTTGTAVANSWLDAIEHCDTLTWAGHDNWYLPDEYELLTIVDYSRFDPALYPDTFPSPALQMGVTHPDVWSSSRSLQSDDMYLIVGMESGMINERHEMGVGSDTFVLCVRRTAQASLGAPGGTRFQVTEPEAGKPRLEDLVTGLVWQGCPAGRSGPTCGDGSSLRKSMEEAIDFCNSPDWGSCIAGWRLPTVKELYSIVDNRVLNAAIDPLAFPMTPAGLFWSENAWAEDTEYSWVVGFSNTESDENGLLVEKAAEPEEDINFVRCVCGGP